MTTEQATQPAQETAEPMTAQQAQTEIERLQSDKDFLDVYLSRTPDDHGVRKESFARMTKLFELAHPPEPPQAPVRLPELKLDVMAAPPGEEQQQQEQQQPVTEDEKAEVDWTEAKQVMQERFGEDWQDEMPGVGDSIREVGGDALFEHLRSNYGADTEVMSQLLELQRENERYPLVAALAELVEANMTPNRALLEMERRFADPEFVIRYTDASHAGHKESLAVMRALHIAADPPSFITSGAPG